MQEYTTNGNRRITSRTENKSAVEKTKKQNGVKKVNKKMVSKKRSSNLRAVRAPKVVTIKKQDKAPFPWSIVVTALLFTGLFLFMMMNYAEVDKYRSEIARLDSQIASMEKERDELEHTLGNKYDLAEIERYASENLGMTNRIPESNIHVITFEQGDKTEMHTYDEGEEGGLGFLLTGFGEIIKDFIN